MAITGAGDGRWLEDPPQGVDNSLFCGAGISATHSLRSSGSIRGTASRVVDYPGGTDMNMRRDHTADLALRSEPNSAGSLLLLGPHESRAPTVVLSPAKRAALRACLNGGILERRCGVWTSPSASACDRPVSGITVADLGRDGLLILTILRGSASATLTTRGTWFARTVVSEDGPMGAPLASASAGEGRSVHT